MNSKEFLKKKLSMLSTLYPSTVISYYFDAFDNDHFVCIHPKEDLDQIIDKEAQEIDQQFIEHFPLESLSFIEEGSSLKFDELVYEYQPIIFKQNNHFNIFTQRNSVKINFLPTVEEYEVVDMLNKAKEQLVVAGTEEFALAA